MKIQVVWAVGPELFETTEEFYDTYGRVACARPETELIMRPLRTGLNELDHYDHTYFQLLNSFQVLEGLVQAEKEGADAAIVGCYFDPAMRNARGICRIPIVGVGQSSMMFASLMGRKFAIVVPRPGQIPIEEENLVANGMRSGAIDDRPIRSLHTKLSMGLQTVVAEMDLDSIVEDFKEVSRSCIEDGAEVVIPGCLGLAGPLAMSNVTDVDGAPIVDPLVSAVKVAEAMVDLSRGGRPWISRNLMYKLPSEENVAQIRRRFGIEPS